MTLTRAGVKRRGRPLLLVCVLASLLVPGLASASIDVGLETRVGGFDLGTPAGVGGEPTLTHSTHQGYPPAYDAIASGFLLAARGTRYGPLSRGPLPDAIANTFRSGSYTGSQLSEATTLYRVHGGTAGELGSFWTRTPPAGPLQSQIGG